jgi:hypothetical protein
MVVESKMSKSIKHLSRISLFPIVLFGCSHAHVSAVPQMIGVRQYLLIKDGQTSVTN